MTEIKSWVVSAVHFVAMVAFSQSSVRDSQCFSAARFDLARNDCANWTNQRTSAIRGCYFLVNAPYGGVASFIFAACNG
jgi:hypothetical protein